MMAERDTTDRYLAAFLSDRVGADMAGRVSGVARFGVFVRLDETGADGLIPVRSLGSEFFHFDKEAQVLEGSESRMTIAIGQRVVVRLTEAVPVTGGLMLELLELDGKTPPRGRRSFGKGKPTRRKHAAAKSKRDKIKRKVSRRRG